MWALFLLLASPVNPSPSAAVVHGFQSEQMCQAAGSRIAEFSRGWTPGFICVRLREDAAK